MSSWRDSVSAECQSDVDSLLDAALPLAKQMLAKHGEFFPYGMAMSRDGQTSMLAGYTGSERPLSADVLTLLYDGLRAQAEVNRAAAVVSDVRVKIDATDAIQVELEHKEGIAMAVILPYRKKRLGAGMEYGQMSAHAAARRIWPASGP